MYTHRYTISVYPWVHKDAIDMYTNGYTNWCIGHLSYIYKYNVFGHHVFHSVKLASKTLRRMRSLIETGLRGHPFRHGARGKLGLVREELPRVKGIRLREFAKTRHHRQAVRSHSLLPSRTRLPF